MERSRTRIRQRLEALADASTQASVARLVPGARSLGVKVPQLRELAREIYAGDSAVTVESAAGLVDELFESGSREEALVGIFFLGRLGRRLRELPWPRVEAWARRVDNWEVCDQLASNVGAPLVAADLALVEKLVALAGDPGPWVRRFALANGAALNHRGRAYPRETLRICERVLVDEERTIRQALGWALREASKKDATAVFEFLVRHREVMPCPVVREAAAKLSPERREALLED